MSLLDQAKNTKEKQSLIYLRYKEVQILVYISFKDQENIKELLSLLKWIKYLQNLL